MGPSLIKGQGMFMPAHLLISSPEGDVEHYKQVMRQPTLVTTGDCGRLFDGVCVFLGGAGGGGDFILNILPSFFYLDTDSPAFLSDRLH